MLDLLPYLGSMEGQESNDEEMVRHIAQCRIPDRSILDPTGPCYTLLLDIILQSSQGLLVPSSATSTNIRSPEYVLQQPGDFLVESLEDEAFRCPRKSRLHAYELSLQ